jgi:thiol:disulfide interchange protein DsbC
MAWRPSSAGSPPARCNPEGTAVARRATRHATRHAARLGLAVVVAALLAPAAWAQEAAIRKTLAERYPELPKLDEVSKTPIAGLYELRIGNELMYSDESGNHLIQGGEIIDTKARRNLTEARVRQLTAVAFSDLALKDAIVWKNGNGSRKLAIFADPNCGYCKQFERTLQNVKDVTVYTFLIPILGGDSPDKAKALWCAKDNTAAWRQWMLEAKAPPRAMGACDTAALERNVAFSRKYRINSTPALVFEDGTRIPGALPVDAVEKQLAQAANKG